MRKAPTEQQKAASRQKRADLRALSQAVKPLVEAGQFESVNEGILAHYSALTGARTWHTFRGWKAEGRAVNKGEQGFAIWGKPKHLDAREDAAEPQAEQWFPLAHLFHEGQVGEAGAAVQDAPEQATIMRRDRAEVIPGIARDDGSAYYSEEFTPTK